MDGWIEDNIKLQYIWENIIWLPTQLYDLPDGRVGNRFVSTLAVELDATCNLKWKA